MSAKEQNGTNYIILDQIVSDKEALASFMSNPYKCFLINRIHDCGHKFMAPLPV